MAFYQQKNHKTYKLLINNQEEKGMAFCESCGVQLTDQEKFCHSCGAKTAGQAQVKTPQPMQGNNSGGQQYTQTGTQQFTPAYVPPPQNNMYNGQYNQSTVTAPLSVGQYILTFILLGIPLVNIILLFVWSFGSDVNLNKKNFCRAVLIIGIIATVLSIALGGVITAIVTQLLPQITSSFNSFGY